MEEFKILFLILFAPKIKNIMRKYRKLPKIGQKRIVRKFLWTATQIGTEVRWLEYATIEQLFVPKAYTMTDEWENLRFID